MCSVVDVNVQQWAMSLLHQHQGLTPQLFSMLTRDQKFAGILTYLLQHVRPPEEQRVIKLNLRHATFTKQLRGVDDDEEGEDGSGTGLESHLRLRAALLDANMAINEEVKEINIINQRVEESRQSACEARRRTATLTAACSQTEVATNLYQNWTCYLDQIQQHGKGGSMDGSVTNVAVQRMVKGTLSELENVLPTVISKHNVSCEDIHQQKVTLWECVGDSLVECGPGALLSTLVGEVKAATRDLHTLTHQIDLAREARQLRLKCEMDGTFIDDSNPGGVVKGVRELLQLMCASHVQLCLQAHQDTTHTTSLTRALATLTNNISAAAKRKYSDEAVSACIVELVRENIALVGEKAALSTILALISNLQPRATKATQAREAVRAKHTRICTFEKKVQESLSTIHNLTAAVEEGWPEIENILKQLHASVEASLSLVTSPTPIPPHSLTTEGDFYTKLPLACLITTDCNGLGQRQKVKMLNTPLVWYSWDSTQPCWEVVSRIKQGMTSWEGVYQAVCEHQVQTNFLYTQLERLSFLRASTTQVELGKDKVITSQDMKKLKDDIDKHDKREEEEVVHLSEDFKKELNQCDELLAAVTTLLQDWWEQPAKNVQVKL
ncbi:hypothetical protein Pcinc_024000 [Petrolisthes cinctipes]|uniref:Uncharacterized protein n=1 Tax=Petrolisthes cinctipes TaxID=88211 RepID=A0AAE1KFZ1_PETCI|nr:hypothetical protein Pcinc_024000 [Petrolisthes cinctipes]